MKMRNVLWTWAFLAGGFLAAQDKWDLDKAHSSVSFEAEHIVMLQEAQENEGEFLLGATHGAFKDFDITFTQGRSDFSDSRVEAVIRVNSIDTGHELRDGHLKSESFFYMNKYPVIVFKSDSFEKTGENTFKISGDLTMRGVTKPVEMIATLTGEPVERSGYQFISITATGKLNRYDYGLRWNEVMETGGFRISNYIKFSIQGNFMKKK